MTVLWAFLKSPLGRQIGLFLAALALLIGLNRCGYQDGVKHEQDAQAARVAKAQKAVVKREKKADAISTNAGKSLERVRIETRYRTKTITERIPIYVTSQADAQCVVGAGFVGLWNQAASGREAELAGLASGSLDAPSGVRLSDVLAGTVANFGIAYDWKAEAMTWRAWYGAQKAAWEKP